VFIPINTITNTNTYWSSDLGPSADSVFKKKYAVLTEPVDTALSRRLLLNVTKRDL